jgi:hypothetical protein
MMTVINLGLRFSASLTRLDISENSLPAAVGVRLSEYLREPILERVQGPTPRASRK